MPSSFASLGVPAPLCRALEARGITEPFPIQSATIADALAGRDVCGRAPTGSGKTLAFGIPLIVGADRSAPRRPGGLVLAPTRELAEQIAAELDSVAGGVRVAAVYGGVGYRGQVTALRRGVDVLVACPGRLEDLIDQGEVDLGDVTRMVIDEADRMADMGFLPAVRRILARTAPRRQTVLFSATLDGEVAVLMRDHQRDPVRHEVGDDTPDVTPAAHLFWLVDKTNRVEVCAAAIAAANPAIVFCRTRHGADRLAHQLAERGVRAGAIHGGRSQSQRSRALELFMSGTLQALVATDVAARGIHVDGVAAVVHHDLPADEKTYVHRSGRTARAGNGGVVVTLATQDQRGDVRRIQRRVGMEEGLTAPDPGLAGELVAGERREGRMATPLARATPAATAHRDKGRAPARREPRRAATAGREHDGAGGRERPVGRRGSRRRTAMAAEGAPRQGPSGSPSAGARHRAGGNGRGGGTGRGDGGGASRRGRR